MEDFKFTILEDKEMKAISKLIILLLVILSASLLCIACSDQKETGSKQAGSADSSDSVESGDEADEKEPVTISVLVHWEEDMFNERFKEPIEKRFPHITLEQVRSGSGQEDLEEVFASGTSPDIFFELSQQTMEYLELDYDLSELIEKHSYDVSHINPVFLDSIRSKDKEGRLLALPYEIIYHVLFYNKDIFDLFGQPYPTADMTWSEALELARNLTGERNGVHYRGLDLGNAETPLQQLAVNKTDPETGEVLFDQPEFGQYFDLIDQILDIQGKSDVEAFDQGRFDGDQTTAMVTAFVQGLNWWKDVEGLNMDVAPLPVWDNGPAVSHRPDGGIIALSINPESEHKDAAFDVITYFTENEYQEWASRNGIGPSSSDESVLDQFFQDYESTHDKNVASIFAHPPATPPEQISQWDQYVDLDLKRYSESDMDSNEYLRVIEEESAAKIQDAKNSQ
ncbi:ABC transporter substrate-binding protein [Lederbergia ruris]|uniref:ABC transporter substrate-binding protein n=1 Tax=Lederbergia ruris TaxID=217495 RepID=A0ABQ4KIC7_9BACI|nr:extracellular solute-binding protein [Lederbergia ruris]GIN57723.1 ABC transporter substrate-binding protein [Lederbergia ruris]